MDLNADFAARVALHTADLPWRPSPMPGVERRMLDRLGDEVARATSIVRYAAASAFSAHTHGGGEEFIVLDGTFQDEHGDYPPGSYVRNPPTTAHTPASATGCTIFVKLWQFDPSDRTPVRLDMSALVDAPDPDRPGVSTVDLYRDERERVQRHRWAPGATVPLHADGGAEILVLSGAFDDAGERFERHDWLRLPDGYAAVFQAGPDGAEVWIKTGHLRDVRRPDAD